MSSVSVPLTLHIGYPRTATTLLQQQLEFNNPHILFLGRGTRKSGRWFDEKIESLWEWVRYGEQSLSPGEFRSHVNQVLLSGAASGAQAAVISDETLCKSHGIDWYRKLSQRLYDAFPDAMVLMTLRNQVDMVFSLYGLACRKNQSTGLSFANWFLEGGSSRYVPVQDRFNYFRLYSHLIDHYPPQQIRFLFYEDFVNDPDDYRTSLASVVGVNSLKLDAGKKINVSGTKSKFRPSRWFQKSAGSDAEQTLSSEHARNLAHLFYLDNDQLQSSAGLDLSARGYPTLENLAQKYEYYRR